jgi:hypothetical protein
MSDRFRPHRLSIQRPSPNAHHRGRSLSLFSELSSLSSSIAHFDSSACRGGFDFGSPPLSGPHLLLWSKQPSNCSVACLPRERGFHCPYRVE